MPPRRARRRRPHVAGGILLIAIAAVVAAGVALKTSKPALTSDPVALAEISLPLGGAKIESVSAVTGPANDQVPVHRTGGQIWPSKKIHAGETLTIRRGRAHPPPTPRPIGRGALRRARGRPYDAPICNQHVAQPALSAPAAVTPNYARHDVDLT